MLSDVSSAPNDIDHAVQTLGAHIRRLSDQQRQELTNLYQQAQSDILRRIEDDGQVDESTRFRLRNARLIMQRGEIIPQEPRQEPAIMEPIRQAPPNPSPPQGTLPNVVIAAASVVKGGDEVTTVSAPVFPPGLGTSRHVQ